MKRTHRIYFLQRRDGLVKMGTTSDLEKRIADLTKQHGPLVVLRVINGDQKRELAIHHQFRAYREFGEWFRPADGVLLGLIDALDDGDSISVAISDARKEWISGELASVDELRATIAAMLEIRGQRHGTKLDASLVALTEQYGFPSNFLRHVYSGRAVTVTAYGHRKVREAYMSEMQEALSFYRAEIARENNSITDAELFEIGDRVAALAAKIQTRKARLK